MHAFKCIGDAPGRLLIILNPGGAEGFYRDMNELPADAALEDVIAVGNRHGIEVVGPPI